MDKEKCLFEFRAILNPIKTGLFTPRSIKLMLLNDHLIFKKKNKILAEIPYNTISTIKAVRSVHFGEDKAHIYWGNHQETTFSVCPLLTEGTVDMYLTEQVVDLVLSLRDGTSESGKATGKFEGLKPKNLRRQKIKTFMGISLLILLAGLTVMFESFLISITAMLLCVSISMIWATHIDHSSLEIKKNFMILFYLLTRNKAINRLRQMAEIYPNDLDIQWLLARIYFRKNKWNEAKQYCHNILNLSPAIRDVQQMLDVLSQK